jgi:hypothetical protein
LVKKSQFLTFMIGWFPLLVCIVSIASTRMYRGLSDYLGHTSFYSTQITRGVVRSNSMPFGKFIARPRTGITSNFGSMQNGSQLSVQVIGPLTVASSDDTGEKASSASDENV